MEWWLAVLWVLSVLVVAGASAWIAYHVGYGACAKDENEEGTK